MKKLCVLAFILCLLCTAALAAELPPRQEYVYGDYTYTLTEDGTAEIAGYSGSEPEVVIPAEVDGHPVTAIGDGAFRCCGMLTGVSIPDSVTFVGANPFAECYKLQSITLSEDHPTLEVVEGALFHKEEKRLICYPSGLENERFDVPQGTLTIGDGAFMGNLYLDEVTLPEGLISIGLSAFEGCRELDFIALPDSLTSMGWFAFSGCETLEDITLPENLTEIGLGTFDYCSRLRRVAIPAGITAIDGNPFEYCREELTFTVQPDSYAESWAKENGFPCLNPGYSYALLPDGTAEITRFDDIANPHQANEYVLNIPAMLDGYPVTSIGEAAFAGCNFLTEAIIPEGVTGIGGYAFQNCRGLQRVELPESVASIGEYAFHFCISLGEIVIPDRVECISSGAFSHCFMLESVAIPESVTVIGDRAFFACESLKEILLPEGVTAIGETAFAQCHSLTYISIPVGVSQIEKETFLCCESLENIHLPDGLVSIGEKAFSGCETLPQIVIPGTVTRIGTKAFYWCPQLCSVTLPDGPVTIEEGAFLACSPELSVSATPGSWAESWAEENGFPCHAPGFAHILLYDGTAEITGYSGREPDLVIPNQIDGCPVTSIGDNAFRDRPELRSVTLPEGVTHIGNGAFRGCGFLEEVTLPQSLTYIKKEAFYDCPGLTALTVPESVCFIGDYALCGGAEMVLTVTPGSEAELCARRDGVNFKYSDNDFVYEVRGSRDSFFYIIFPDGTAEIAYCGYNVNYRETPEFEVEIPAMVENVPVTSIGMYAFFENDSITGVTVPEGVTVIHDSAFAQCNRLYHIDLPQSLLTIGNGAFFFCDGLKTVDLPENLVTIGEAAFCQCFWLEEITIPATVTHLGNRAFDWCEDLRSVSLPEGLVSIGEGSFQRCSFLERVVLPQSLETIGAYAFEDCSALTDVIIPPGVSFIGENAFRYCGPDLDLTLTVTPGSYAESWAEEQGFAVAYPEEP